MLGPFVLVGRLDMLAEMMMNMREGLLAIATGAVAGGFANFFILRRTWLNAQALGDRSDGYVVELRKLHGKYDDVQREPVRAPVNRPPPLLPFAPLRRGCAAPQSGSANREPATLPAPALTRRTLASAHSAWRCRTCSTFGCGATCQTLGTAGLSAFTRRRAGGCSRAKGPHGHFYSRDRTGRSQWAYSVMAYIVHTHCGFITNVMFRPKHPWARFLNCAEEDQKLNSHQCPLLRVRRSNNHARDDAHRLQAARLDRRHIGRILDRPSLLRLLVL